MWGVCKRNGDQPLLLQAGISRRVVEANRPALFRLFSTCLTSLQSQSVNVSSKIRCSCGDQLKFTWIRFCKAPREDPKAMAEHNCPFSFHKSPPNFRRRRPPYKMNASWKARQSVRPAGNLARNFVNTSHSQIFSVCVCHLEQLHAQSPFLFLIVFSFNLIPFFDICSVDLLAVFQPGCSGICYFATLLRPLRGRNSCCLWFWQLVFGVWLRDATSNLPSSPNPLSNRSVLYDHNGRKHTWESIHTSKTVVFFTIQRSDPRISTSYKFPAPRYRLPCRLYRWAPNLTFQRHGKIAQLCRNHKD